MVFPIYQPSDIGPVVRHLRRQQGLTLEHVRRIPHVATALDLFRELGHGVFVAPLPKSSADDVAGWITEAILTTSEGN